jgi:hypothetical protein
MEKGVSVIICTCNGALHLPDTLRHISEQTFIPIYNLKNPESSANIKACNLAFWRKDYFQINGYHNEFFDCGCTNQMNVERGAFGEETYSK